ncbi:Maf family protein [Heyndrickxia acidicola]|uniref:dTTP/UTP pyrophosphatase n=1 Tax=Heyndrickxia acidicola TaxID=209389 RepID=A0ABU6MKH4_9BACI|nr:Maf family protein [Heyndrickxia acidicola]MED1204794.1 Maf family protein [Heyndrickxia acidicola]
MTKLILASGSPRRKELLEKLQIPFQIKASNSDETISDRLSPEEAVVELATRKAMAVSRQHQDFAIIGADTIVVVDGEILGKPSDRDHAKNMLMKLSGRTHEVFTGVAIIQNGQASTFYEKTDVAFWELSEAEVERYLDSGEPFDKAGSYGIQGLGSLFVKKINGDYYSVVGLPISKLQRLLRELKLSW